MGKKASTITLSTNQSQNYSGADINPNKITYYCENRDTDFDQKMHKLFMYFPMTKSLESRQFPILRKIFNQIKITRPLAVIMNISVSEPSPCSPE